MILCPYCGAAAAGRGAHTAHLVTSHAELLFHCDECDQYVDRKDLILHMTVHAVQYSLDDKQPTSQNNNHEEKEPVVIEQPLKTVVDSSKEASDFSDQSDAEEGFGPLPQSVFTAIEDSPDSPPPPPPPQPNKTQDKKECPKEKKKWARACPYCPKVYTASSSYFYHIRYSHKGVKVRYYYYFSSAFVF